MSSYRRPVALIVLDGVGLNPDPRANAVAMACHPHLDRYMAEYPFTTLTACGEAVGLSPGQMGDSNVGHLNLGAGRVVWQTLVRINKSIADGTFAQIPQWQAAFARTRAPGAALHLLGLVSDGGVHSHVEHLHALLDLAAASGVREIYVHACLDGRDVAPQSALTWLLPVQEHLTRLGVGRIATVSGRYWAMDRDQRWERTQKFFRAMVLGEGERTAAMARQAVEQSYAADPRGDEFVLPTVVGEGYHGLQPEDAVICFNFRPDRMRQMVRALYDPEFTGFARPAGYTPPYIASMTQYDESLPLPVAFNPQFVTRPMGQVVSEAGLRQLRIAETEKYPHVTYFFNGGEEPVFPGEERVMIPSPKDVPTYDKKPQMSAYEITEELLRWIEGDRADFIVLNFANGDMVGHTGVLAACIKAVEVVDECLGRVVEALRAKGGAALVLADHGNCDQEIDYETGLPHTNHTLHPVPCILIDDSRKGRRLKSGGVLANAAPTLLEVIGLARPPEMDAESLIEPA